MRQITWKDITVQQFMDIYSISKSDINGDEKVEKVISILFNLSEKQVEELEVMTFNNYAKQCNEILKENVPGKPVRYIKVGKKKYKIEYDPTKLRHRQYVEIQFFQGTNFEETMKNIHLLMASIIKPVRFGFFVRKNNVNDHEKYANDMLNARIIDVYHACLFFLRSLSQFNRTYPGLFSIPNDAEGSEEGPGDATLEQYNRRYGWIYSTKRVADFENTTIEDVWEMNIRHVLNDLSYLKASAQIQNYLDSKKKGNGPIN